MNIVFFVFFSLLSISLLNANSNHRQSLEMKLRDVRNKIRRRQMHVDLKKEKDKAHREERKRRKREREELGEDVRFGLCEYLHMCEHVLLPCHCMLLPSSSPHPLSPLYRYLATGPKDCASKDN